MGLPWCREVGFIQRLYIISTAVRSILPDGLLVVTVSCGWFHPTVIYYFHGREVGITRRFIIIIITTAPFDVEGREVGYPTIYDGYMVRYIVEFLVSYNHFNIYGYCIS